MLSHISCLFFSVFNSSSFFVLGPRLKLFLIHNTSKVFLLVFSLCYWIFSFYLYFSFHFLQCSYHFIKSLLRLWVVFVISIHLIILVFLGGASLRLQKFIYLRFSLSLLWAIPLCFYFLSWIILWTSWLFIKFCFLCLIKVIATGELLWG